MIDGDDLPASSVGDITCPICEMKIPYGVTVVAGDDPETPLVAEMDFIDFNAHALTEHGIAEIEEE